MDRDQILAGLQRLKPWFHCIDLGDGLYTKTESAIGEPVEHPLATWQKVQPVVPDDLTNQTVLDVGCNAGFYSIEMKRRGATRVLGVDSQRDLIRQAEFVRNVLGLDIEYRHLSVYDLDPRKLGQFDVTLALGLIYHCKHLVLALEKLFLITRNLLILETAIYPPEKAPESFEYAEGGETATLHPLAYIENLPDAKEAVFNWFVPGTAALTALLKNIGFDDVQVFPGAQNDRAVLACTKREPYPDSRSVSYLGAGLAIIEAPPAGLLRSLREVAAKMFSGGSRDHEPVTNVRAGQVISFTLRAENTGFARWRRGSVRKAEAGDVHLVAHLLDENGEVISWYHAGALLPRDVPPGEAVDVKIDLHAPEQPGNYLLEFGMVSQHLAWFDDLGSETLRHSLRVESA